MTKPSISIIGAGKVGSTLARLLFSKGYRIEVIYSRNASHAKNLVQQVHAKVANQLADVTTADLTILSVSDDAITSVASQLSDSNWEDKGIIHTSGAHSIDALHPLANSGVMLGSLHPAFPFADVESAINSLIGATFAIEASHPKLYHWLLDLIQALEGHVIVIPENQKARYHLALAIASNYTVTLYSIAQTLLQSLTENDLAISNALNTLLHATVDNIKQQGIPDALTGPLVRADTQTIQSHLDAIDDKQLHQLYLALAQATLPLVTQRGVDTHTLESLL
ncbi:MAG: DUF2520 domain-containing protein [Chloroflexota bacterium]